MAKSSTTRTKKKAAVTRKSASTAKKSPKTKKSTVKKSTATKATQKNTSKVVSKNGATGDDVVLVDRRAKKERRGDAQPTSVVAKKLKRREKVTRRRQIDPTTCERDYSPEEVAFMAALDEYKRKNGRMFPTCSEILEVIRELGYQKVQQTESPLEEQPAETPAPLTKLPESPVLSLSSDFALPADSAGVFEL